METRLNDNEVKEVAEMQKKIDSYEGFIVACHMMAIVKKKVSYPVFDGTNLETEMNTIWRTIRDAVCKE